MIHLIWLLKDFGALKTEIDTLDTDELVKVLTGLNNLKTKLNYLDVGKLKIISINLLSYVESKKVPN